ncbi:ATP-binding protein [Cupriavidus necator]|uniref:nSTAND1 domain-containing NTPase n=1 Tax=Cupriavidus necator TaxID=106590 RepID=UPI003F73B055
MKPEDLSPELRAAGEMLLKAWQERSADERLGVAELLGMDPGVLWTDTPPKAQPVGFESVAVAPPEVGTWSDEETVEAIAHAEKIAAVSGPVEPSALVPTGAPPRMASLLVDQLAPSFDRAWKGGAWSWTLKSERRAHVLRSLKDSDRRDVLARAADVATDAAGIELRRLLAREAFGDIETPLEVRTLAYEWAAAADPEFAATAETLRRQSARNAALESFDHLLQHGFFGRDDALERIRAFVRQPEPTDAIPLLPISGIGGAGKSTLLAKALGPMLEAAFNDSAEPMIVSIDFDRRCLLEGAELELSYELSRQLALYFPQIESEFARLRGGISGRRAHFGELSSNQDDAGLESITRGGEEFDYAAGSVVRNAGVHLRPLVLVLDTFEEWQRERYQSGAPASGFYRVLEWLSTLQDAWQLRLRVILSGRSPPPESSGFAVAAKPIMLGELKRGESVEMLLGLGVPTKTAARQLARMAGGMPLSLKLAARYYLQLPTNQRIAFLRDTTAALAGVSAELRQGILYRRFLDHIADERAQKVAHPGLALRRVSAELIRDLLAQPCGLGSLDSAAAETLFGLLAREVWLVEEQGPYLVHRPELRRVMLKAMREDPVQAPRVRAVHEVAARWYSARRGGSEEDAAEALYHQLALATSEEFEPVVAKAESNVLFNVAQSADDLPDRMRVRLLDRLGRRLSMDDAALLPEERRLAWANGQAEELVRTGQPRRALDLWRRLGGQRASASWYPAAAFQAQAWNDEHALLELDYSVGALRYAYLMSFVLEDRNESGLLRDVLDARLAERIHTSASEVGLALAEDAYFSAVLRGSVSRTLEVDSDRVAKWLGESQLNATRYLRLATLQRQPLQLINRRVFEGLLASSFRPTPVFVDEITSRLHGAGSNAVAVSGFRHLFEAEAAKGIKSSQALGAWAERFAQAVIQDAEPLRLDVGLAGLLVGFGSDDPEWRTPIRNALVGLEQHRSVSVAISSLHSVLHPWVPTDLNPERFQLDAARNPRRAWLRAVEYVDRCGALPALMESVGECGSELLHDAAQAYLAWQARRRAFESLVPNP